MTASRAALAVCALEGNHAALPGVWIEKGRSQATLRRELEALEPGVIKGLRFVSSDMRKS